MLTKKQHELLVFIHARLSEGAVSPSFEEMKEALNLRSKSGIHRLISGLEERGFIRRLAHRARALEVVRLPDGSLPSPTRIAAGFPRPSSRASSSRPSPVPRFPSRPKRSNCRSLAASRPGPRSKRCATPAPASAFPPRCYTAAQSTMLSKLPGTA